MFIKSEMNFNDKLDDLSFSIRQNRNEYMDIFYMVKFEILPNYTKKHYLNKCLMMLQKNIELLYFFNKETK